jgi:hypothetical protein
MSGFFPALGGALVAAASPLALAGCARELDEGAAAGALPQAMASERVRLRPGMRYANVMPRAVPAVRRLPQAGAVARG